MDDKELIKKMGGVAKISKALGFKTMSRVGNWVKRGIPARIKLNNQKLFEELTKASNE